MDPGKKFWTGGISGKSGKAAAEEEIVEEARDLNRREAEKILRELYDAGKITANDCGIFDQEPREKKALWSRRVHTLEVSWATYCCFRPEANDE